MVTRGLETLPPAARARLEQFSRALERLDVDDLPLYAIRERQPAHRRSVEAAALAASESGLTDAIDAARAAVTDYVTRAYGSAQYRAGVIGLNSAPGLGTTDERVRVLRSIGDAVTAIVLGDRLEERDHAELMGAWDRLIRGR
jgi:hypothetical protein